MRRLVLASALAAGAMLVPQAQAAGPQVTDAAGDANFSGHILATGQAAPGGAGNQAYADVLSVEWKTVKKAGKATGFQVITTLSAPPVPPAPTSLVYRMLSKTPNCGFFGVVYYTHKSTDTTIPQSAVRDNCIDATTRLTALPLPVISGSKITWTVPFSVIPKDTKVANGSTLTDLFFTVVEIEDFRTCLPDDGGRTGYGKACGLGYGTVEEGETTATYKLGS